MTDEKIPQVGDTWYRFEDKLYAAPLDEFDMPRGSPRMEVMCREYVVKKVTEKGVWLGFGYPFFDRDPFRHVLFDSRKKFACPSKEEALESFIARKSRQCLILDTQLGRARKAASEGRAMLGALQANNTPEPEDLYPAPSM